MLRSLGSLLKGQGAELNRKIRSQLKRSINAPAKFSLDLGSWHKWPRYVRKLSHVFDCQCGIYTYNQLLQRMKSVNAVLFRLDMLK